MATLSSPEDMLAIELRQIYSAERQLSRFLPRITKKVTSDRLRALLDQRRERGAALIEQLDEAFEALDISKGRAGNPIAQSMMDEVGETLQEIEDERFVDPLLLAATQKLEHVCIAAWGTAAAMGRLLGEESVVSAMERVLDAGKQFDQAMTELADEEVNPRMLAGDEEDEEETDDADEEDGEDDEEDAEAAAGETEADSVDTRGRAAKGGRRAQAASGEERRTARKPGGSAAGAKGRGGARSKSSGRR